MIPCQHGQLHHDIAKCMTTAMIEHRWYTERTKYTTYLNLTDQLWGAYNYLGEDKAVSYRHRTYTLEVAQF